MGPDVPIGDSREHSGAVPERADIAFERRSRHRRRTATVTILAIPAFAFVIPFIGALISLATPIVAASRGTRVWPSRRWKIIVAAICTVVALWSTLVAAGAAFGHLDPVMYLAIPLCAPTGTTGVFVAPAIAILAYGAVSAVSVAVRRVWIWPIGAIAGALSYAGAWELIGRSVRWVC